MQRSAPPNRYRSIAWLILAAIAAALEFPVSTIVEAICRGGSCVLRVPLQWSPAGLALVLFVVGLWRAYRDFVLGDLVAEQAHWLEDQHRKLAQQPQGPATPTTSS